MRNNIVPMITLAPFQSLSIMEVTMNKKITQSILVLVIGLLLVAASPLPGMDDGDDGGSKWYCGTTAFDPQPWGSSVRGKGEVACTTKMSWLRIDVELTDYTSNPDRTRFVSTYCYDTTSCDISAYLNRINNHWYITDASGYWPTSSWYDVSNSVYIVEDD